MKQYKWFSNLNFIVYLLIFLSSSLASATSYKTAIITARQILPRIKPLTRRTPPPTFTEVKDIRTKLSEALETINSLNDIDKKTAQTFLSPNEDLDSLISSMTTAVGKLDVMIYERYGLNLYELELTNKQNVFPSVSRPQLLERLKGANKPTPDRISTGFYSCLIFGKQFLFEYDEDFISMEHGLPLVWKNKDHLTFITNKQYVAPKEREKLTLSSDEDNSKLICHKSNLRDLKVCYGVDASDPFGRLLFKQIENNQINKVGTCNLMGPSHLPFGPLVNFDLLPLAKDLKYTLDLVPESNSSNVNFDNLRLWIQPNYHAKKLSTQLPLTNTQRTQFIEKGEKVDTISRFVWTTMGFNLETQTSPTTFYRQTSQFPTRHLHERLVRAMMPHPGGYDLCFVFYNKTSNLEGSYDNENHFCEKIDNVLSGNDIKKRVILGGEPFSAKLNISFVDNKSPLANESNRYGIIDYGLRKLKLATREGSVNDGFDDEPGWLNEYRQGYTYDPKRPFEIKCEPSCISNQTASIFTSPLLYFSRRYDVLYRLGRVIEDQKYYGNPQIYLSSNQLLEDYFYHRSRHFEHDEMSATVYPIGGGDANVVARVNFNVGRNKGDANFGTLINFNAEVNVEVNKNAILPSHYYFLTWNGTNVMFGYGGPRRVFSITIDPNNLNEYEVFCSSKRYSDESIGCKVSNEMHVANSHINPQLRTKFYNLVMEFLQLPGSQERIETQILRDWLSRAYQPFTRLDGPVVVNKIDSTRAVLRIAGACSKEVSGKEMTIRLVKSRDNEVIEDFSHKMTCHYNQEEFSFDWTLPWSTNDLIGSNTYIYAYPSY